MSSDVRLTLATRRVLATILDMPDETYAYQIMRESDLPSGTVVPILARLLSAGILSARWEDLDPSSAGRPRRCYYRLTDVGRTYVESRLQA